MGVVSRGPGPGPVEVEGFASLAVRTSSVVLAVANQVAVGIFNASEVKGKIFQLTFSQTLCWKKCDFN